MFTEQSNQAHSHSRGTGIHKLDHQVLEQASRILERRHYASLQPAFTSANDTMQYIRLKLTRYEHEVFAVMFLDTQHRLLEFKEMFYGTIDACAVYPREILRHALSVNAGAVILAHNHPSGVLEPSAADRSITNRIRDALMLIDVRVLDHIIVGDGSLSFAERGLL